ncbi:MAG: hypothetical protein K1X83_09920 [Oligoflexia bacterium]|nr:hypothetical protein [Oligoflexia bacterium]
MVALNSVGHWGHHGSSHAVSSKSDSSNSDQCSHSPAHRNPDMTRASRSDGGDVNLRQVLHYGDSPYRLEWSAPGQLLTAAFLLVLMAALGTGIFGHLNRDSLAIPGLRPNIQLRLAQEPPQVAVVKIRPDKSKRTQVSSLVVLDTLARLDGRRGK